MIASIDIGTSYSSICILGPDGRAQPVDIGTGTSMFGSKYSLPSAVFVEDGGNVLVGQAAMNSRRIKPQNFRMEFKRNLGEDIPILLGSRSFKPEELYTELFRHMKSRAEDVGGQIEKTYLTYPASYGKRRREKLLSAASAAGLFEIELVDEPTAAAMCYCAEGYVKDGQTLLIYDFGGGTFDVSLTRYQDGAFQLLSEPMGLERCGGMDIDYLIAQDMKAVIDKEVPGAWEELEKSPNRFMRFTSHINELAVRAKHHLSDANRFEEYIEIGMDDVPYELTVERLNEMIAPLVGQTLPLCRRALEESGISPSELSAVLLVGGTSRIPLVREMVRKITGKPALCAADLELAVARGALMYNEYQKREKKRREEQARVKAQQEEAEKARREAEESVKRMPQKGKDLQIQTDISFEEMAFGCTKEVTAKESNGTRTLKAVIPAGIEHGRVLKFTGQGGAGKNGGPRGDLYLKVGVSPHPFYRRSGSDICYDAKITTSLAAKGGEIEIPTLGVRIKLQIPPETKNGTVFRVKKKGILAPNGYTRGDFLVTVKILGESAAPAAPEPKEALGELVEKFIASDGTPPEIKKHLYPGAVKSLDVLKYSCEVPANETVLLAHDDTYFRSGKDGFVITDRGIYVSQWWIFGHNVFFTDWPEFMNAVLSPDEETPENIHANGKKISALFKFDSSVSEDQQTAVRKAMKDFWTALQKYLRANS